MGELVPSIREETGNARRAESWVVGISTGEPLTVYKVGTGEKGASGDRMGVKKTSSGSE